MREFEKTRSALKGIKWVPAISYLSVGALFMLLTEKFISPVITGPGYYIGIPVIVGTLDAFKKQRGDAGIIESLISDWSSLSLHFHFAIISITILSYSFYNFVLRPINNSIDERPKT